MDLDDPLAVHVLLGELDVVELEAGADRTYPYPDQFIKLRCLGPFGDDAVAEEIAAGNTKRHQHHDEERQSCAARGAGNRSWMRRQRHAACRWNRQIDLTGHVVRRRLVPAVLALDTPHRS